MPRAIGMYTPKGTSLAMVDSKIEVTVRGPIIEAVVTQRFQNKGDRPTEATYVFPLPVDAAVSAMSIESGNRTIRASIAKRAVAQQRYEDAVRAGVAGALLDQERPDVFTQTVAAVPARGTVAITLRFDTIARYQDGVWELVLPLVVAPRYVPGVATNRPTTGTGRAPDTNRAPDASRITPGGGPGAGGTTEVTIHFTDKPTDLTSPTHELKVAAGGDARFVDPKTDHDAVVRWKSAAPAGGWVEQSADGGYAAVVVEAPPATKRGTVRWMLVLDRSAASRGDAEAAARPLVRGLFASMSSGDRVAVTGSDQIGWGTASDVGRAVEAAWSFSARAFDLTRTLQRAKSEGAPLVLVSGGLVADDRAAIAAAGKLGVPIHVIGVGPAPARGVLARIASASGGTLRFAIPGDDMGALAKATLADLSTPPAPLAVTWGTLAASEVVPGTLPRLGAGQAMLVLARVRRAQTANGRARGELFAIEALPTPRTVTGATTMMGPLARRWARNRLDELISSRASAAVITAHALRYGLVSPYTSMVAIGTEVVVQGGVRRSVAVPVSVPAGMKWQQVKKETTVDSKDFNFDASDKTGKKKQQEAKQNAPDVTKKKDQPRGRTTRPTPEPRRPSKQPPRDDRGGMGGVAPTAPPPSQPTVDEPDSAKRSRKSDDEEGDADGIRENEDRPSLDAPAPRTAAAESVYGADAGEVMATSSSGGPKKWRLATSFAAGFAHANGESSSLLTAGARLEIRIGRTRSLAGIDAAAWLVDGDTVVGRTLLSFARVGIARWLELGAGVGFQFGDGAGPAAGVSLRFHLPPAPRGAIYLRYDGALIYSGNARTGQNSVTTGLEWSF